MPARRARRGRAWAPVRSAVRATASERKDSTSEIVSRIRAIERFVAQREVGNDVALDRRLQERPLQPRRIARETAVDGSAGGEPNPGEDLAAEAFDQRGALAGFRREENRDLTVGHAFQNLSDEAKRFTH